MPRRCLILAVALGLGLGSCLTGAARPEETTTAERVARLIALLASPKFAEREEATRALDVLGPAALPALREAANSEDIEVGRRAETLVKQIERRVERARILAPTSLQLTYRQTPLAEAVKDLARRSGYNIVLRDGLGKLADRTITLDTGPTTFWSALDQFCQTAGLVEGGVRSMPLPGTRPAPPGPALPRALPVAALAASADANRTTPAGGKGLIVLLDGKPVKSATHYAGSVRIRVPSVQRPIPGSDKRGGPILLLLEISPEPKHEWFNVTEARIDQVHDDKGQELTPARATGEAPANPREVAGRLASFTTATPRTAGSHQVPLWIAAPDKKPEALKKIRGLISAQVQLGPQPLLAVESILQAAGQISKGAEGGFLKVLEVTPLEDGPIRMRVELQWPPHVIPGVGPQGFGAGAVGGVLQLQAAQLQLPPAAQPLPMPVPLAQARLAQALPFAGWSYLGLALLDDKGKAFQLAAVPQQQALRNGPLGTRDVTLVFKPEPGQGKPTKLVFSGSRQVTLEVPFTLENVPLP